MRANAHKLCLNENILQEVVTHLRRERLDHLSIVFTLGRTYRQDPVATSAQPHSRWYIEQPKFPGSGNPETPVEKRVSEAHAMEDLRL